MSRAAMGLGLLALVWTGLLLAANAPSPAPVRARLVSYNIQALASGAEGVVATLRRLDADIVALQEVDVRTARSGGVDQPELLARALGMKARFAAAMPYDGGGYGLALLSREAWSGLEVLRLPRQASEEPRIALRATTRVRGLPVTVINTHLAADWRVKDPPRLRREQAAALARWVGTAEAHPVFLLGDFNCEPGSEPLAILESAAPRLTPGLPTWPADAPRRALDHLLLLPGRAQVQLRSTTADPSLASDHLPLVADLEIRAAAPK